MGFLDFLFGKKETIWTMDAYIEDMIDTLQADPSGRAETRKKIKGIGERLEELYGTVGLKHAWIAVCQSPEKEVLCELVRTEWKHMQGWEV